jgi:anti-anti-sigma factor
VTWSASVAVRAESVHLELTGDFTGQTSYHVAHAFSDAIRAAKGRPILVYLTGVTAMDDSGYELLRTFQGRAQMRGSSMFVMRPSDQAHNTLVQHAWQQICPDA